MMWATVLLFQFASGAAAANAEEWALEPFPPLPHLDAPPVPETLSFISRTLGDHMVLQRAPQQAVVWGHTTAGATVQTTFNGATLSATADANGTWRQTLPATQASKTAYQLTFASSAGERGELKDVLFGDVYLCGGQSNMAFSIGANTNKSAEQELAGNYSTIRIFTVGTGNSSNVPFHDLQTVHQQWSVPNATTITDNSKFGYFSSVCWFFGRRISEELSPTGEVPVGLISNNWGGTPVEHWSTPEAFAKCNRTFNDGRLFYAMINPYTVGPMAISGFTWYQGESNTRDQNSADQYACLFPAMISEWRRVFNSPDAYFGYIHLSTWCPSNPIAVPEMRDAQQAALLLPKVGYATNADHGAGCNIHPPAKQYCGKRLGDSALALHYGKNLAWKSPTYASARAGAPASGAASVSVSLSDLSAGGLTADVFPYNYLGAVDRLNCASLDNKTSGTCAWAALQVGGAWLNATVSVAGGGSELLLRAPVPPALAGAGAATASAYGWGPVPLLNAYDKGTGLPVLPWNRTV